MSKLCKAQRNQAHIDLALDVYYDLHVEPSVKFCTMGHGRNPSMTTRRQHFEHTHYFRSGFRHRLQVYGKCKPIFKKQTTESVVTMHSECCKSAQQHTQLAIKQAIAAPAAAEKAGETATMDAMETEPTAAAIETMPSMGSICKVEPMDVDKQLELDLEQQLEYELDNQLDLELDLEKRIELEMELDMTVSVVVQPAPIREPVVVKIGDQVIYDESELLDYD